MPRFLSIVGWSGAGKTTLIAKLLPELRGRGLRVGVLKHSGHPHPLHAAGSDTALLERAGAAPVGFLTPKGGQVVVQGAELRSLAALESTFAGCDLVLVEGWKDGPFDKIEVLRPEADGGPLTSTPLAYVTDAAAPSPRVPCFRIAELPGLALFLIAWLRPDRAELSTVQPRAAQRLGSGEAMAAEDLVAREEPLEIRVHGDALATTMRTPGDDAQLAVGFLFSEGWVHSADDLGQLFHCGRPDEAGYGNTFEVQPAPGLVWDLEKRPQARRGTLTTSACGVCGRQSIDDLLAACGQVHSANQLSVAMLAAAARQVAPHQRTFAATGGTHAAALFSPDGALLCAKEDVGRHNAVDKVVGELVLSRRLARVGPRARPPLQPVDPAKLGFLWVSSRASFEVVQKAAVAQIPVVCAVGAATTLAVDLADRAGVTLCAFSRQARLTVYTHPERIREGHG